MNFSSKTEWTQELERLKTFFKTTSIPESGVHQIDGANQIHDLKKAIQIFVLRAEENIGNPVFQGTLVGLQNIEKYLRKLSDVKE